MAKEILLNLLESKDKAVNNLFRFSRTKSELDDWIDYIKDYAITASFKLWKESNEKFVRDTWGGIQSQQKGKPDASQTPEKESNREISRVTQIEEMFNSGELVKLLDEMKLEVEEKIADDKSRYGGNLEIN